MVEELLDILEEYPGTERVLCDTYGFEFWSWSAS